MAVTQTFDVKATAQALADQATTDAAARAVIQADIDQNESDADTAIAAVQTNLDTEEAARIAADSNLQDQIDAIEAGAAVVDQTYNASSENAQSGVAIAGALSAVQSDIDQNESDSDTAIALVQSNLDAYETSNDTALAAVQADVDQNEADADTAIAGLQTQIDALDPSDTVTEGDTAPVQGGAVFESRVVKAISIAVVAAIPAAEKTCQLYDVYRYGIFRSTTDDISAHVANDPRQGVYVAFDSDATGASGGWVRECDSVVPDYFRNAADTDDYDCLAACAAYVTAGEATEVDYRMREYSINRTKRVNGTRIKLNQFGTNGVDDIIYSQVSDVTIRLNGAKIQHGAVHKTDDGDGIYTEAVGVCPFFFDRCTDTTLVGHGVLDGGVSTWTADAGITAETPSYGVVVFGGDNVTVERVTSRHWDADGMIVAGYTPAGSSTRTTCTRAVTRDCTFTENARSGLSNVGCADYRDYGSRFTRNGYGIGGAEWHSPSAGFNHEVLPNQSVDNCSSILDSSIVANNGGAPITVSSVYQAAKGTKLIDCTVSFDYANLTPLRAVTQRVLLQADGIEVVGGRYTDVGLYAPGTEGESIDVHDVTLVMNDPSLQVVDSVGISNDSTSRLTLTDCNIRIEAAAEISPEAIHLNAASGVYDSEIFISRKAHDGTTNDIYMTLEAGANSNGNYIHTDLFRYAITGEEIAVGQNHAVRATDTDAVYQNGTASPITLSGTTAAELLSDGLTLLASPNCWWRVDGGYKDERRRDTYGEWVSDSATGYGWARSNTPVPGVLVRNTTKSFKYGIDESKVLVDSLSGNVTFTLTTANLPDDAMFEVSRTDTSSHTLTVAGEDVTVGRTVFGNVGGSWAVIEKPTPLFAMTDLLTAYADDTAASGGGVGVGEPYINSSTGAVTIRQS